jgi:alpha-galactosidase
VRTELTPGTRVFESRKGLTGHHGQPWVTLDSGDGRSDGEAWSVALEWSGSWKVAVQHPGEGAVSVTAGINDFDSTLDLPAGGSFIAPMTWATYSPDGRASIASTWHDFATRTVLREPRRARPVLYNSWEATEFAVSHDQQLELARIAAELGVELFVVDDGWFGARHSAAAGLGDWTPNPEKFPRGFAAFADDVHALGMLCGIWVEPEMVNPDSDLHRAHPEWVIRFPDRDPALRRGQLVLNLARNDVQDWMLQTLDRLVTETGVDYIKWDANRPIADPGWGLDADGTEGDLWTGYVHGLYRVLDGLIERHPKLLIEACSGGGGRVDLGMLRRAHQAWTSDNTDALDRIPIQAGYALTYPALTMAAWVTDVPNFLTKRDIPLAFRFHCAMRGVLGIGGDLRRFAEHELEEHREFVRQYLAIRPVVQFGRATPLEGLEERGLDVVQYASADGTEIVVSVLCPSARFGPQHHRIRLASLPSGARWSIDGVGSWSSETLMSVGLPFRAVGDYSSMLAQLARAD